MLVFADADRVLTHPSAPACLEAARVLRRLEHERVPLVLCASKTRAEIQQLQQDLGVRHPFVCESGGAAFIPAGYFRFEVPSARSVSGYQVVEFGRPYGEIVPILQRITRRQRIAVVGFNELSVEEVASECELPLLQARLAKLREYSERFRILDPSETVRQRLFRSLEAVHLRCVAGDRYDLVGAGIDAGLAVGLLRALYARALGPVVSLGPGDVWGDGGDVVDWAEAIVDGIEGRRHHAPHEVQ